MTPNLTGFKKYESQGITGMFLAVKGKANLSFLLRLAQLTGITFHHRNGADLSKDVVTPRKKCFRSLNFSFPKLAAKNLFSPQLCLHTLDVKSR